MTDWFTNANERWRRENDLSGIEFALLSMVAFTDLTEKKLIQNVMNAIVEGLFVPELIRMERPSMSETAEALQHLANRRLIRKVDSHFHRLVEDQLDRLPEEGPQWAAPQVGAVVLSDLGQTLWLDWEWSIRDQLGDTIQMPESRHSNAQLYFSRTQKTLPSDCPRGASEGLASESRCNKCTARRIGQWKESWWRPTHDCGFLIRCLWNERRG